MKSIILSFVILFLSSAAIAQLPETGYIGIYADEYRSTQCVSGTGFYPFTIWVWCLPSMNGTMCAEFDIMYPANVITSTVTLNYDLAFWWDPFPGSGISVCYFDCQYDWHWLFYRAMYCTDETQTIIAIAPHPDAGEYQFANCYPGYPIEPCIAYPAVLVNVLPEDCPEIIGTEETSWGAIKGLYR
jgi:hypothetical protein